MTSALPLILSEEPVSKDTRSMITKPHVAVVYADAAGQLTYLGRPLNRTEARRTFKTRYEVDLSDHRRTAQLDSSPLPSRGDAYFFRSTVDVGFRVTNPEAVVKRNVADALGVVYGYLIGAFRPVTRRFEIRDSERAESALNALFQHAVALDEGITIYRCVVRLLPDHAAQEYLRTLDSADRALAVNEAHHTVARATAHQVHELAGLTQQARIEAESREHDALASRPLDFDGLIRAHLTKHPDETAYALELLQRHYDAQNAQQDINDKRSLDLVRYMIEQGMIQSVDIELLRKQALGRVQEIASPSRPAELTAGSWDDPLPSGPVLMMAAEPAPAGQDGIPRPVDTDRTVPVYIAFDESSSDPAYFEAVNRGVRTLPADLAAHPEVIDAIRLAVLGYAGTVTVRMPLTRVAADSFVPELTSRPGSSLSSVFDYLRDRISEDVGRLKSQGLTVGRPVLYLLCAATPGDSPRWESSYLRLTDKAEFPTAPNIVACGIGQTHPGVVRKVTSQPQSSGWVADPGTPLDEAVSRYTAFVRQSIAALGRAHVTGGSDAAAESPAGFRVASGSALQ
jgi:uncharacterized protein YegL